MYYGMKRVLIERALIILVCMVCFNPVWSHNGDKDARGGHIDNSDSFGMYHFHEGPLAGQAFLSEELATAALDDHKRTAPAKNSDRVQPLRDKELSVFFPKVNSEDRITVYSDYAISNREKDGKLKWVVYKIYKELRVLGRTDKSSAMSGSSKVSESYFLPNMFSQFAGFNLRIGRKLDLVVKDYARQHESLVVVTGPILENGSALNSANNVLVPNTYFKVVLDISEPTFEGLAFVVPSAESNERVHETGVVEIEKYVVPIAKVEQLTGIDLFANLENDLEAQIESRINYSHWNIENTPSSVNPKSWGEIKNR